MTTKIILAGASGLIGGQVARLLGDAELHVITRRQVDGLPSHAIQHIADNSEWPGIVTALKTDVAISCLGTTISKAGSKQAFAAIDHDLVIAFAAAAKEGGARQMIAISSVGASAKVGNFYLSTKGAAEDGMRVLAFDRLDLLRPGLLRGDRAEHRVAESLGIMLSPLTDALMFGSLRKYRSIDSAAVAKAVAALMQKRGTGAFIHENDNIATLAG